MSDRDAPIDASIDAPIDAPIEDSKPKKKGADWDSDKRSFAERVAARARRPRPRRRT